MATFNNNQLVTGVSETGKGKAWQWWKGMKSLGELEKLPSWTVTLMSNLDRPSYAGLLLAGSVANSFRRQVIDRRDKQRFILFRVIAIGLSSFVFLVNVVLQVPSVTAAAGINSQINFQGKIVKNDGSRVTDNDYSFTFGIYAAGSGGSPLWSESKTVHVAGGLFNTALGDTNALPGSIDFNSDSLFLGVNFNGDGEMSPRIRLTAAPYAINAKKVAGLTVTDTTGTLTIPNGKTIQFADDFTTSGAFPITLTAGTSTNVTLPSSGTLATLAGSEALTNKSINGLTINVTTGSLTIPDTKTISFADAFTTSGLFPLTLTTSASTNVTLPTSGTLVTLAGNEALSNKTYNGLVVSASTGTLTVPAKTIQFADAFTTSGAYPITLTVTNTTGVTLPTTGTLATLAGNEALTNKSVNGLTISASTGTLTVPAKTISFADAFTTSGAYAMTLTATNTTNVTLPTSGTLSTLAGNEALTNKTVNGLTISASTGTLTVPSKTISFGDSFSTIGTFSSGGNFLTANAFTTSGNYGLTLTTTNTTSVTLPTSGTLTTLAGNEALTNKTYNGLTISASTGTLTVPAKTIQFADAFTTSGVYPITLTATNTTGVTLPTTGTLATLAGNEALTNKTVNGLTISASTGTLTVPAKTIQFADAFSTSGAYAITLTATNTTGVTLPTTGTLATLAGNEALTNKTYNGLTITASTGTLTIPAKTISFGDTFSTTGTFSSGGNFSSANAFTTSGNYGLTLTTTALTNVTLPTSGTLATLAGAEALTNKTYSGTGLTIAATAPPTADMVVFTNAGQAVATNGISDLQITYVGGGTGAAGGIEASGARIDLTPGGTPSSLTNTWNGLRVVAAAGTWPATSVVENGIKIAAPTTIDASGGTFNNILLGTSTGPVANSYDRARIAVGNIDATAQQNYATLQLDGGGTGFLDVELMNGFINFQNINTLYDDFTNRVLDPNKWTWGVENGAGATCSGPVTAVANGVLRSVSGTTGNRGCQLTTQTTLSNGFFQQGNNPVYETRVRRTTANTAFRFFAGFANAAPAGGADVNTAVHAYILKRAADTTFFCGTGNGAAETVTNTGVTWNQNTLYRLRVQVSNGSTPAVVCVVDDGTTVTRTVVTATQPGAATLMDYLIRHETSNTTSKTLEIDYARAWQDDPPVALANNSQPSTDGLISSNGSPAKSAEIASTLDNMNLTRTVLNNGGENQVIINNNDGNPVIVMDDSGNASFSGILTAKALKSESIVGLDTLASQLKMLNDRVNALTGSASGLAVLPSSTPAPVALPVTAATASAIINFGDISIHRADVATDMKVAGNLLVITGLTVEGPTTFKGDSTFEKVTNFLGTGWFKGDIFFDRSPKFGVDTVGFAVIPKGADHVDVAFSGQFNLVPVVNASMVVDSGQAGEPVSRQTEVVRRIMQENLLYFVTNPTTAGFSVYLNKPAEENLTFSWTAFAGDRARTVTTQITPPVQPVDSPSPGPMPTASPVPTAVPAGTSSASAGLTPVAP